MKQKDIALIVVIVLVSAGISLLLSNQIFAPPKNRQQEVEVVQPITADFPAPDKRFFNDQAFDPTKVITIGPTTNPEPFKATSQ
jgi:hypothetical protein